MKTLRRKERQLVMLRQEAEAQFKYRVQEERESLIQAHAEEIAEIGIANDIKIASEKARIDMNAKIDEG